MKKEHGTLVFEEFEVSSIISRYLSGESINAIAKTFDVSNPTIGRLLQENKIAISHKKRNSIDFITSDTTKQCTRCKRVLPLSEYNYGNGKYGRRSVCRECDHELHNTDEYRERRRKRRDERRKTEPGYAEKERIRNKKTVLNNYDSYKKMMVRSAKQRAKEKCIPFDVTYKDFEIPETCPLLGIKLNTHVGEKISGARADSPSLDKINPELGYTKGNVWVVSYRANMIKSNASIEELELLVKNLKDHWIH